MQETVIAIITVALIVTIYIGTYVMNKKMPAPYQKIDDATCGSCANYSCGIKQNLSKEL